MKPTVYIMLCVATAGALLLGAYNEPREARAQRAVNAGQVHETGPAHAQDNGTVSQRIQVMPRAHLVVAERGGSATVAVLLSEQPDGDVVLRVSSSAPDEGAVQPDTLRFTPQNWYTPQLLRVQGVDDPHADGDRRFRVMLTVDPEATTDRSGFARATVPPVGATSVDDEGLGAEGTLAEPLDITLLRPAYRGQVDDGESHYVVRHLAPARSHAVRLSELSGNADVSVFADPAYSRLLCRSCTRGTRTERCIVGSADVLYVKVNGKDGGGATYLVDVD